jgi:hypothetical protein
MIARASRAAGKKLASFLSKSPPGYRKIENISMENIATILKLGDIILVEGGTRISSAIKYLTQSSWSHACLCIKETTSTQDTSMLLEADLVDGVRTVRLDHYSGFNIRICRPVDLSYEEKLKLVNFAKSKLGHQYDLKNIFDLMRYLIQKPMVPNRYRRAMLALGSGEPTKAICSTLVAESFQVIDYPILPISQSEENLQDKKTTYSKRHFTHFTPRDFDLSPYFEIIKPTIAVGFDFHKVEWQKPEL